MRMVEKVQCQLQPLVEHQLQRQFQLQISGVPYGKHSGARSERLSVLLFCKETFPSLYRALAHTHPEVKRSSM